MRWLCNYWRPEVSIPFQWESVSKDQKIGIPSGCRLPVSIPFQWESVSKDQKIGIPSGCRLPVSIPFQRESVSKATNFAGDQEGDRAAVFPFPSNGKVSPKQQWNEEQYVYFSCFDSLPTGKRLQRALEGLAYANNGGFRFPSNGKASPKPCFQVIPIEPYEFRFPSNGKASPKVVLRSDKPWLRRRVSIPFQRESVSKDWVVANWITSLGFDSLPLGKCLQRQSIRDYEIKKIKFRFPSNGKVSPKVLDPNNR